MSKFSFNPSNIRLVEARALQYFKSGMVTLVRWLGLISAVATMGLVLVGIRLGFVLGYLPILCLMLLLWRRWRLMELDDGNPIASGSMKLDELLQSDIVGKMVGLSTATQAWPLIIETWQGKFMTERLGLALFDATQLVSDDALTLEMVYPLALEVAKASGQTHLTPGALISAILWQGPQTKAMLGRLKLSDSDLISALAWQKRASDLYLKKQLHPLFGGVARDWASGYTQVLDQYGTNLSKQIEKGYHRFSSVARPEVVSQMATLLGRGKRGSVALVGDIGSGKTELVYSLAEQLLEGQVAGHLAYKQIIKLDASALVSQLSHGGNIDDLMRQIFFDAQHATNIILFLDEAQLFLQTAPGSMDISQILYQTLEQTGLAIIFALSPDDWHHYNAIQPALFTLLNKIELPELSEPAVMQILADLALPYEASKHVTVTYSALRAAYKLSGRYITDKAYPAKAINLLEDSLNYPDKEYITQTSVQNALEKITGAKIGEVAAAEKEQLLNLEELIHKRMINQTHAVSTVAEALRRSRAGVRDPKRPAGSFLLLGPTGVGKTELARSLAAVYFGGEQSMIRLDMSEYQQPSDVARILEAPSARGQGSVLLRDITARPFSVVLLDEIEKAHPDILNLLLQLIDEGNLTDTNGKSVSFKEAIIIATSNAGADEIRERISRGEELAKFKGEFTDHLISGGTFKPELLNRFDDIVLFRPLTPVELVQVVRVMLGNLNQTLANQNIVVELTDAAVQFIVDEGYDPRLGARPMRRALQQYVENTISRKILTEEVQAGSKITLDKPDLEAVAVSI